MSEDVPCPECGAPMMSYGNGAMFACHDCKIMRTFVPEDWELRVVG